MRARQDRWRAWIGSFPSAEDVADRIDMNFQPGLAHHMDQELAAAELLDGEHQSRDGAATADADPRYRV